MKDIKQHGYGIGALISHESTTFGIKYYMIKNYDWNIVRYQSGYAPSMQLVALGTETETVVRFQPPRWFGMTEGYNYDKVTKSDLISRSAFRAESASNFVDEADLESWYDDDAPVEEEFKNRRR